MNATIDRYEETLSVLTTDNDGNCLKNNSFQNQAGLGILSFASNGPAPALEKDRLANTNPPNGGNVPDLAMQWFVMRDLKRPNAKMPAYKLLANAEIEVFTPMKKALVQRTGKAMYQEIPFIPNLLFVHSTAAALSPILRKHPTLQYRFVRGKKYKSPMTVPDADMTKFINAIRSSELFRYYRPEELTADMYGRKVRIIGGPLENYEGRLLKRYRKKILLIELQGFLSAGVKVSPEYIQFI